MAANIYTLSACDAWAGTDSMRVLGVTTDETMLYAKCSVTPFDISRLGYPYMDLVCNALYIAVGEIEVVIQAGRDGQAKMTLNSSQYQQSERVYQKFEQLQSAMIRDMERESADETMDSEVMEQ